MEWGLVAPARMTRAGAVGGNAVAVLILLASSRDLHGSVARSAASWYSGALFHQKGTVPASAIHEVTSLSWAGVSRFMESTLNFL